MLAGKVSAAAAAELGLIPSAAPQLAAASLEQGTDGSETFLLHHTSKTVEKLVKQKQKQDNGWSLRTKAAQL